MVMARVGRGDAHDIGWTATRLPQPQPPYLHVFPMLDGWSASPFSTHCPYPQDTLAKLLGRVIQTTHWGDIVCRSCLPKSLSELALVREEEEERQEVGTPHPSGITWRVQDSLGRKNYTQPRSSLRGLEMSTSGSIGSSQDSIIRSGDF